MGRDATQPKMCAFGLEEESGVTRGNPQSTERT